MPLMTGKFDIGQTGCAMHKCVAALHGSAEFGRWGGSRRLEGCGTIKAFKPTPKVKKARVMLRVQTTCGA